MKLTEKEMKIIEWISDETEFEGCADYIYFGDWNMTIYRGVISSLIQKGICGIDENCTDTKEGYMWLYVKDSDVINQMNSRKNTVPQCNRQCKIDRNTNICESCGMNYN
jgi:hypothetical protein